VERIFNIASFQGLTVPEAIHGNGKKPLWKKSMA
jgi:hypothetical protein